MSSKNKHWKLSNEAKEKHRQASLGQKKTLETRKKISSTRKQQFIDGKIKSIFQTNNPSYNPIIIKRHKQKWKEKYSNGYINPMKGKKRDDLALYNKLVKVQQCREKNPNWKGGLSFGLYGVEFNEELKEKIRTRDNRTCQVCTIEEKDIGKKLCVHHIDYNKTNNQDCNLISVCTNCHVQTNFNRDKWTLFFNSNKLKEYENKYGRVLLMVGNRDRPTELALLLNSLRNQTYKLWDILIIDDASGTPIQNYYFLIQTINKLQFEGHNVIYIKNPVANGVSAMRQQCIDVMLMQSYKYKLSGRIDDDSICENNYIEKLIDCIDAGYDIASGVVPIYGATENKRDIEAVKPIIGECELDGEGNLVLNLDDCGQLYNVQTILPSHHFRSCALFKREVFEKGVDYKSRLSKNGFREEQIISFKALIAGFKIGINTGAICWHLNCPSGGERDTMNMGRLNQEVLEYTTKRMFEDNGDFIRKFNVLNGLQSKKRERIDYLSPHNLVSVKPVITIKDMDVDTQ